MRRLLILTVLYVSTIAYADPGGDPSAAGSGSGSGGGADIAPPAPGASPKQVEDAKDTSKAAALHPIIPSPGNATRPAYQLYAEIDPPIIATGVVFMLGRTQHKQPAYCAPECSASGLNALDKVTAGYYSANWSLASDYELYGLGAASAAVLFADEGPLNAVNDAVVLGEAAMSAAAVASIMTLAAGRPRPLLYSTKAPLSIRNSGDAGLSFISGHTTTAFALATSLFITEHRLHPNSKKPYIILGAGLVVSTGIATARVMSGYHFITDVIGGAVVGTSIGVLVSSVHESPVHVVPVVNHDPNGNVTGAGLGVGGDF